MKSCVCETWPPGSGRNKELISAQTSCVSRVSGPHFLLISYDITLDGGGREKDEIRTSRTQRMIGKGKKRSGDRLEGRMM